MSRVLFTISFLISVAFHGWLLTLPPRPVEGPRAAVVIPIVETELARVGPPEIPQLPEPEPPEPQTSPKEVEPPQPPPAPAPATPQPPMTKVAEAPESASQEPGDFAGDPQGRRGPDLRIDWGTDQEARAALEAGGMLIVVLNGQGPKPVITQQVVREEGVWRRRSYRPAGATVFSNRLRIVDDVPAFREVRDTVRLSARERLAVVVPMRVERVLSSAQMEAAFSRGLVMRHIDNFAGRFILREGGLAFDITHVRETARSASP